MTSKKQLRKEIRALGERWTETNSQAYFAEQVCRAAGQLLDPANAYVAEHRRACLEDAYRLWKEHVPETPYRGICVIPGHRTGWPRAEYKDADGFWRVLTIPSEIKEA